MKCLGGQSQAQGISKKKADGLEWVLIRSLHGEENGFEIDTTSEVVSCSSLTVVSSSCSSRASLHTE